MRAPACSVDIRAEVAELLGAGVGPAQSTDTLMRQGEDSVRRVSLAGGPRLVVAGSHAVTFDGAAAHSNAAHASSEHYDVP